MFIPLRGLGSLGVVADSQGQALPIGAWKDARNMRFSGLSMEKMLEPTLEAAWDSQNGTPVWFQGWSDQESTYFAVVATGTGGDYIWVLVRGSAEDAGTWVQKGGPYDSSGQWQSFAWGDTVIFNNGANPPQIYDGSAFVDLPNWGMISSANDLINLDPPSVNTYARCDWIVPYKSFLVAGATTEGGVKGANTVWWSNSTTLAGWDTGPYGTGGPPNWDYESPGSLSGKSEVGGGDGELTWAHVLNEALICYNVGSATAMQVVGGSGVMDFRRLFNKGCAGLNLAVEFNNQHYVLAPEQIYIHDGSTVKLIAKDRVEEEFFRRAGKGGRYGGPGDVDFSGYFMVKNPDRKEIVLVFNETYDKYQPVDDCAPYDCAALLDYLKTQNTWAINVTSNAKDNGESYLYDESGNGRTWGGFQLPPQFVTDAGAPAACDATVAESLGTNVDITNFNFSTWGGVTWVAWGQLVKVIQKAASNNWTQLNFATHGGSVGTGFVIDHQDGNKIKISSQNNLAYTDTGLVAPAYGEWFLFVGAVNLSTWEYQCQLNGQYASGTVNNPAPIVDTQTYLALMNRGSVGHTAYWRMRMGWVDFKLPDFDSIYAQFLRATPGYTVPDYCDNLNDGYAPVPTEARGALVYNFEDDNYTWMDASVDKNGSLIPVPCMSYAFEPGWVVTWAALETAGTTWADLQAADTRWSDFSEHGTEKHLYWLATDGVYRSDQVVKTDGVKDYFVTRDDIDLDDIVQQWNSHNYKYSDQMFMHIEQPRKTAENTPNPFNVIMGAKNNLMDVPTWRTPVTVNLNKTNNNGRHKADFRVTGRYLAMRLEFNATGELRMSGAELKAEEAHGR